MRTLTISMPTYNTPQELLDKAVGSIIDQTWEGWKLVVVNDGGDSPVLPSDERITLFELDANRGRYYADAVVLWATDSDWWTPHDSDDYSGKQRLQFLLSLSENREFVTSQHTMTYLNGKTSIRLVNPGKKGELRSSSRYTAGIYRTDIARMIGGPHADSRGSYDTTFTSLLWDKFEPAVINEPLYHVVRRRDSLTTHPDTRLASANNPISPWRAEQKKLRKDLYKKASKLPIEKWAKALAPSTKTKAALEADIARLKEEIG